MVNRDGLDVKACVLALALAVGTTTVSSDPNF